MHTSASAMDPFDPGNVVAARLMPQALGSFDPVLRRLLGGTQLFVKQTDGRWAPRGCQLGLACCFSYDELQAPVLRD
jgi:hypothetical protein